MPKYIPHLREQILSTAYSLFSEEGFDAVSMRRLAAAVGIAVGTLYNYFPDKQTIFHSLFRQSWEKTFAKLEKLYPSIFPDPAEARRKAVEVLYGDIKNRIGFAVLSLQETPHPSSLKSSDSLFRETELVQELKNRLLPFEGPFKSVEAERIVQTLLASIRYLITQNKEDDKNILFLHSLFESLQEEHT